MTFTSVWIGYGCLLESGFWSTSFGDFWQGYQSDAVSGPFEVDEGVLMIALATTAHVHAEFLGIIELPYDTVFALDDVTCCIPHERIEAAQREWECLQQDARLAGSPLPDGKLLFAHTVD